MNRSIKLLSAIVVTLLLSFGGYIGVAMIMDDQHFPMMQHSDARCVNLCLAKINFSPILAALALIIQLFSLAIASLSAIVVLSILSVTALTYGLRPRPSPNLKILYERYLI